MVEVTAVYEGALRVTATHAPSQATLQTDAPVDNQGKGEAFSPTDLMGTALGTCCLTILGIVANRREINLDGAHVHVEKHMATTGVRRIARLPVHITVTKSTTEEDREAIETAVGNCPVHKSLHPEIDAPITFDWE